LYVLEKAESNDNIYLAKTTLDDMEVYYQIVNDREDFMTELRTGKYNLYMLLDSKLPLTGNDDKELAAEVAKGNGIIASRDANGDNLKNLGLFGVKFKGSTPPDDYTVDFSADSKFGEITLNGTGKAQNVELEGGQQQAVLNSKKGASPGAVTYKYEAGKTILFTFDIGSCSGNTAKILRKAIELTAPAKETNKDYAELEPEDQIRCYDLNGTRVINKITCAGMPAACYTEVTWENFFTGSTYNGKLAQKTVKGGMILEDTTFELKEKKSKIDKK
jgi:hypothetical protein